MGLDPRLEGEGYIPKYLIDQYDDPNKIILEFNKTLIDNTHELIPVIKPQIAFYEKYDALNGLKETIKYAHKHDLLVILDSKRNDIGSTSEAYAYSTFQVYNADACTLNAYFGIDGIRPYLENYKEKGMFILVKTSNPSSRDFQNLFSIRLDEVSDVEYKIKKEYVELERNYIHMAKLVERWTEELPLFSGYSNLGIVVGATFPDELKIIRQITPASYMLIPGYGAQGGSASEIKYGFDKDGLGAIVNSSRNINYAYNQSKTFPPEKFGEAARKEIKTMNLQINKIR